MNYEDLTKRIEKEKRDMGHIGHEDRDWWDGYISALTDLRDDLQTQEMRNFVNEY